MATVTVSPEPSERALTDWTRPLPKVFLPTRIPLLLSLIAPDKISLALADPSSIRTTTGLSVKALPLDLLILLQLFQ